MTDPTHPDAVRLADPNYDHTGGTTPPPETPDPDHTQRMWAIGLHHIHDPENQTDNPYDRCKHCHYERHPCDIHDLAGIIIDLYERLEAATTDPTPDPMPGIIDLGNGRWLHPDGYTRLGQTTWAPVDMTTVTITEQTT